MTSGIRCCCKALHPIYKECTMVFCPAVSLHYRVFWWFTITWTRAPSLAYDWWYQSPVRKHVISRHPPVKKSFILCNRFYSTCSERSLAWEAGIKDHNLYSICRWCILEIREIRSTRTSWPHPQKPHSPHPGHGTNVTSPTQPTPSGIRTGLSSMGGAITRTQLLLAGYIWLYIWLVICGKLYQYVSFGYTLF